LKRAKPAPERLEDRTLLAIGLPIGSPDLSFNGIGFNTTLVGSVDSVGAGALQPDGKIVVAGSMGKSATSQALVVVRYLPNGHLDTGFGGPSQPGVAELAPGSTINVVYIVTVDQNPGSPDEGDIIVAGRWIQSAQQFELALARFKPDGSLDAGFGTDGVVVDPTQPNATGVALAIQPDDKIVVLSASSGAGPVVERFNPDGTPDPSFGTGGLSRPFGNSAPSTGALAQDPHGNILLARVEDASSSRATLAVARLTANGQADPSFGSNGIATTTVVGSRVPYSAAGARLAIDRSGRIMVAGTAHGRGLLGIPTSIGFWVAGFDNSGNLDPSFNHGAVEFVNFQATRQYFSIAEGVAVQPDGKVVLGGGTFDLRGPAQNDIVLARLDADGTLDESFGEGGWDIPNIGSQVSGYLGSVLVQPDGNIVTPFTYLNSKPSVAVWEFGVARVMGNAGAIPPSSGTLPAGIYRDEFVSAGGPTLDSSQVFQHFLWYNFQPSTDALHAAKGHGWDLEQYPPAGRIALHEVAAAGNPAALDAITFPNLRPDVHVGLASVDVAAVGSAHVTFVGANGAYTVDIPAGMSQTASAGESHVLEGTLLNPSVELGPIREIILDSKNAYFYNLKVLVIPGGGPLDDFVTAAPGTSTPIDVLDYATGGAAAAGLQAPLELVAPPGQPSLPGSQTVFSITNPNDIVYTNTVVAQPGQHPTDSFTYTVKDANGRTATGTVYVTIDTPPVVHITMNPPAMADGPGWAVPKGTACPLTGQINVSDAEQDPVRLTASQGPQHGTVKLTKASGTQYTFSYVPLTTDVVFDDRFTLRVSDLSSGQNVYTSTDYTVAFRVGGRLLDFVLAAPGTSTAIDLLDYATGEANFLGLQVPLELVAPPGQPSLPGSQTAISSTHPNDIVYTNTLVAQSGQHPTDAFTYTVQDVNLKTVTGTVHITIDAPPIFHVTVNQPAMEEADGWALPHGAPGPLTGMINITDAEDDPLTLTVSAQPQYGTLNLTKVSDNQYSFSYVPPTTYAYDYHADEPTGVSTLVSVINGDDRFSLRASDGYSSTDFTVRLLAPNAPPETAAMNIGTALTDPFLGTGPAQFVVPENLGMSYYSRLEVQRGYYDPNIDFPGLVHFAAPGVLWNQADRDGDPLTAYLGEAPQHGRVHVFPDGSFNYVPNPGFTGADGFGFYASDGYLRSGLTGVAIHVVPGTPQHPFQSAPVLHDIHYHLDTRDQVRFTPAVSYYSLEGIGQSSRSAYPQFKTVIRPVSVLDLAEPDGLVHIRLVDLNDEYYFEQYDHQHGADFAFKNDLGLFYYPNDRSDAINADELLLDRSDSPFSDLSGPSSGTFIDISSLNFRSGAPIDVSMTYATTNSTGWLSNFASVVVRVDASAVPQVRRVTLAWRNRAKTEAERSARPSPSSFRAYPTTALAAGSKYVSVHTMTLLSRRFLPTTAR
jgi:uncharacterized delta-60 repeat protein